MFMDFVLHMNDNWFIRLNIAEFNVAIILIEFHTLTLVTSNSLLWYSIYIWNLIK